MDKEILYNSAFELYEISSSSRFDLFIKTIKIINQNKILR